MPVRTLFFFILALLLSPVALAQEWLIDVRTPEEYAAGHADGAINIEHQNIVAGVQQLNIPKQAPIFVYCRSGRRSDMAMEALKDAGYSQVQNLVSMEQVQEWRKQRDN